MEEKIKHYLRPGEQVRWQGAPAPFQLMESGLKSQILIKWGVTAALCAALLAVYFYRTPEPNMGFVGLVLLVAVVVLVSPVLERRNLSGTRYWITDQRVILATRDETLYYMELDKIDAVQTLEGMTEKPCLVLGSSIAERRPRDCAGGPAIPRPISRARPSGPGAGNDPLRLSDARRPKRCCSGKGL